LHLQPPIQVPGGGDLAFHRPDGRRIGRHIGGATPARRNALDARRFEVQAQVIGMATRIAI
jgi:hypothetical protein